MITTHFRYRLQILSPRPPPSPRPDPPRGLFLSVFYLLTFERQTNQSTPERVRGMFRKRASNWKRQISAECRTTAAGQLRRAWLEGFRNGKMIARMGKSAEQHSVSGELIKIKSPGKRRAEEEEEEGGGNGNDARKGWAREVQNREEPQRSGRLRGGKAEAAEEAKRRRKEKEPVLFDSLSHPITKFLVNRIDRSSQNLKTIYYIISYKTQVR